MNRSSWRERILTLLALGLFAVSLSTDAFGQAGTSGIRGTVVDRNAAVIAGATVRVVNPATGLSRTTTTGADGTFSFPGLPPATYNVEVEAANFKKLVNSGVKALVDSPIEINLTLEAGSVTAVVDVTSNTIESVVNTQDASLGNNFVPQQITQLPTDLRRVADLLTLQPGVSREGYVAGGRSDQANVVLDGVDINDQQTGGREDQFQTSQDTVLRATAESVEEFRITTTNSNASQGRSSGAQISLVTKSGTNDFRGSIFYFYRPTAFSANDFFNNAAGRYVSGDPNVVDGTAQVGEERSPRPSLARDVFGGSIGGPIIKDRLFFFYTYEGQRQEQAFPVNRVVPLAHLGRGELKFMGAAPGDPVGTVRPITLNTAQLNSIYVQAGINPFAVAALADAASKYPANNDQVGDGTSTGGFRFNAPTSTEENTHIARFDLRLTDTQTLFARGNYQNDIATNTSYFPDTPSRTFWDHPYGFVVGHDWAINSNMVNNFRYGLTRQAFSSQGDSSSPSVSFRFVFSPLFFARTLSRVTPTQNFTDDFTWIKNKHTFQFGGNVRIVRNQRLDFSNAYDDAITNPSFYGQGEVIDPLEAAGYVVDGGSVNTVQSAATALIGRLSQYSGNFTFDIDGSILAQGTPTDRNFATEEYDAYFQDAWRPTNSLTLTFGLRYGYSRPVYEKKGFQVVPQTNLSTFFTLRQESARLGVPYNALINFEKGGPANNGPGFYSSDWNNWQPRVAVAWSPNFKGGFLKKLFGGPGDSVFRGGFGITNDHFGGQLAVSFDALSTIGFTSSTTIAANTYNVTDTLAPRFTGYDMDIRSLPGIPAPVQRFATEATPACLAGLEECPPRIETSLDRNITTPTSYQWNATYGRQLPAGMYFEASYIGRKARNLLASRDVNAPNNLVDPQSGMDWYTAAGMLHDLRNADTPIGSVRPIPYFENLFPNLGANFWGDPSLSSTQSVFQLVARDGYDILDWTYVQILIDDYGTVPNLFYHPQYAAFSAFSSVARSDYNGATFSLRQRLGETLSYDINYTLSESFDDASGLQTGGSYGSQFILNPLRQHDNYAHSDFDIRHSLNANFMFSLPFGKGREYFSNINGFADALLGGWQLSGIYRINSGLPLTLPFDAAQWATNWNVQSAGTRIRPVEFTVNRDTRNGFSDPQAAYNSFRNARAGETGERNVFRESHYSVLDLGLSKTFRMPWSENHKLALRWEVFNVMNYQYLDADNFTRGTWGLQQDSHIGDASSDFGNVFTSILGTPRRMQFGIRYSF